MRRCVVVALAALAVGTSIHACMHVCTLAAGSNLLMHCLEHMPAPMLTTPCADCLCMLLPLYAAPLLPSPLLSCQPSTQPQTATGFTQCRLQPRVPCACQRQARRHLSQPRQGCADCHPAKGRAHTQARAQDCSSARRHTTINRSRRGRS